MRQEMQLTAQQMAERQRLHLHEFKEQQEEQYRQHTQAIEDRKSIHIQVGTHIRIDNAGVVHAHTPIDMVTWRNKERRPSSGHNCLRYFLNDGFLQCAKYF